MRKHFLLKTMLLLCALIVGSSSAWAEDSEEITMNNKTSITGSYVTFTFDKGDGTTSPALNNNQTRLYPGNTMTITSTTKKLKKVDFSFVCNNGGSGSNKACPTGVSVSTGTETFGTLTTSSTSASWTAADDNTSSVVLTIEGAKGNLTFNTAKVYYEESSGGGGEENTVATPTFDPAGGTFTSAQSVTINCGTADASIYYTTDGSDPDDTSDEYTSAVSITTSGTVLKAIAYKEGMTASSIATATYTIKPTTPTISAEGATVTITGDEGCTFYYTTDGSEPNNESTEYSDPFDLTTSCTIKAIAYDAYNNASGVKSYTFKYLPLNPKKINSGYFEKVTDASTLENGDAILIVYETENVAMSTTQYNNNRGNASVTISNDNVIYAPSEGVQRLVLVKQTETIGDVDKDVFYFYTGDGYLYAPSSGSNYLKTEAAPDNNNNARATISISSGDATIVFTGSSTRNNIRFNTDSNTKKFSCYASTSEYPYVQIYKEVAHNESATISAAEYATYCNATYALDFSETGITAFTATEGETSVKLNEITSGQVPANTPVVLYKEGADGTAINVPVIASADAVGDNDLKVSEGVAYSNAYVLAKPEGKKVGFYLWDSNVVLNAGKVYLKAGDSSRSFLGFEEGNTTSIDVRSKMEDVRGEVYNLNGQRVAQPTKGLYIVNGKKVVVK